MVRLCLPRHPSYKKIYKCERTVAIHIVFFLNIASGISRGVLKHNKEKTKKRQKKKKQTQGKNIVVGKALLQSTMLCVGSYSAFPTPFTIHVILKKIGPGINRSVLKLTWRP